MEIGKSKTTLVFGGRLNRTYRYSEKIDWNIDRLTTTHGRFILIWLKLALFLFMGSR